MGSARWSVVLGLAVAVAGPPASAAAAAKHPRKVTVCRRGCAYSSIQKAVNRVAKGGTVRIRPGTYVEGVVVKGRRKDGITLRGLGGARRVVLQGKGARDADGNPAQNGVFVDGADGVRLERLVARNFPANGFFVRNARGYLMRNLTAAFNRSYGLYAFNSRGGRMTRSTGYGHGDSAFYVGQTPPQKHPRRTSLDHLKGYENVLGYSGTNSRYVDITKSDFFNNGAGIVPNTLKSEKYAPATSGTIRGNRVFWNNFNYFKPGSPVKPLPSAAGSFNYPTGTGVVLFGVTKWKVSDNDIFGNFKWGVFSVSDPTFKPATNRRNRVTGNRMGGANGDANGVDVFTEGSGSGNCWSGNGTVTLDPGSQPDVQLYPGCAGSPPANGRDDQQLGEVAGYLLQGVGQESSWVKHPHKRVGTYKPIDGESVR